MKIAYVHDRIVFEWWGESALRMLMRRRGSEDASVFVLYSTRRSFQIDERQIPIVTALPHWINQLFARWASSRWFFHRLFDYRNLMPFYPVLCRLLRQKILRHHPEQVIISSFAAVKNIVPTKKSFPHPTILYLHSPMQYIRENYDEYLKKLSGSKKRLFIHTARRLRPRDSAPRTYEMIYTNSQYTANCVKDIYHISATVRYPTLDPAYFRQRKLAREPRPYLVYVGRLVRFIREVDLIIQLINQTGIPLLVIWSGPDEDYLRSLGDEHIIFLWQVDDIDTKIDIVGHARGSLNLAKESCGIATMESLALWVPVFAFDGGGSVELIDKKNGVRVWTKDLHSLIPALEKFYHTDRDRQAIADAFHTFYERSTSTR